MNIAVAGTGYVGLSLAVLLSQHNQVMAVDIISEKVDMVNHRKSPIQDDYIEQYLEEKNLNRLLRWMPRQLIKMRISSLLPHLQTMIPRRISLTLHLWKQLLGW